MSSTVLDAGVAGLLGLLVGSFLNVVIHRLPLIMEREWLAESLANLRNPGAGAAPSLWRLVFGNQDTPQALNQAAAEGERQLEALPPLGIALPRSRCPCCGTPIRWWQNIPVVSWLALRGRCAQCKAGISLRYPLVEGVTGGLFALCALRFGLSPAAAFWAFFCAVLVCQFLIDLDTQLLPDILNYLLLWGGLLGALLQLTGVTPASALWGAIGGYMSLWLVFQAYRLATGKQGMGHGDFKLLAALGAWFGATYLLPVILLSSVVGAALGGALLIAGRLAHKDIPIAFGPFLAAAGLLAFAMGSRQFQDLFAFAFPF